MIIVNFPLSAGEAARELNCDARDVTLLLYRLDPDIAPVRKGRRLIPRELLPTIESQLRKLGKLPRAEVAGR